MKKIIETIMFVFFILMTLLIFFCIVVVFKNAEDNLKREDISLKKTIQVCDLMGFSSESIIREKAEQGYRFTGTTKGFFCDNLLNFELKEQKEIIKD